MKISCYFLITIVYFDLCFVLSVLRIYNLYLEFQPLGTTKLEQQRSFQEDLDTPTLECETSKLPFKEVFFNWIRLWRGYSMLLGRSSNVVQVLGSITALCCVDKKGILSWPNPTPEVKIVFR